MAPRLPPPHLAPLRLAARSRRPRLRLLPAEHRAVQLRALALRSLAPRAHQALASGARLHLRLQPTLLTQAELLQLRQLALAGGKLASDGIELSTRPLGPQQLDGLLSRLELRGLLCRRCRRLRRRQRWRGQQLGEAFP